MIDATPARSYRWGKFQGWVTLVMGIFFAVSTWHFGAFLIDFEPSNPPLVRMILYMLAFLWVILGVGLLTKDRLGFVFYYFLAAISVVAVLSTGSHIASYIFTACWWVIPAIFYYPKRWRDFGFGKRSQSAEADSPTENRTITSSTSP